MRSHNSSEIEAIAVKFLGSRKSKTEIRVQVEFQMKFSRLYGGVSLFLMAGSFAGASPTRFQPMRVVRRLRLRRPGRAIRSVSRWAWRWMPQATCILLVTTAFSS